LSFGTLSLKKISTLFSLVQWSSARFGSLAKPTDQKQDSGYRLARAIIRAEPPDHPFIGVALFPYAYTLMWGLCPTHPRPASCPKARGKTFSNIKDAFQKP